MQEEGSRSLSIHSLFIPCRGPAPLRPRSRPRGRSKAPSPQLEVVGKDIKREKKRGDFPSPLTPLSLKQRKYFL